MNLRWITRILFSVWDAVMTADKTCTCKSWTANRYISNTIIKILEKNLIVFRLTIFFNKGFYFLKKKRILIKSGLLLYMGCWKDSTICGIIFFSVQNVKSLITKFDSNPRHNIFKNAQIFTSFVKILNLIVLKKNDITFVKLFFFFKKPKTNYDKNSRKIINIFAQPIKVYPHKPIW